MTEGSALVAFGCDSHTTTASVRISADKKINENKYVEIRSREQMRTTAMVVRKTEKDVQIPAD